MFDSDLRKEELQQIEGEINILSSLDHPNIIKYKGHFKDKEGRLCLVQECAEMGDLKQYIETI